MSAEQMDTDRPATPDEILDALLARYAWWPAGHGHVIDMQNPAAPSASMAAFRNTWIAASWTEGKKRVNPADAWAASPERAIIAGLVFDPTTDARLVEREEGTLVNLFKGLPHTDGEADPEAVSLWQAFLEHLLPDQREREWFEMWLAAKVQKPWVPNAAVLMIHEAGGAGRGTLFEMAEAVLGERHVHNASSAELLGGGGQGQYTSWIESQLMITSDEVLAGGDSDGAMAWKRREAYERLKQLVDPRARKISIIRKSLPNGEATVYASFLLSTNNLNALPLGPTDRRFAVLMNGEPLVQAPDLMARLAPWRCEGGGFSEAFGRALFRHLRGLEVDWDAVREAPRWTEGRARMLAANGGDADELLQQVLDSLHGNFVLNDDLRDKMRTALDSAGLGAEFPKQWRRAQDILSRPNQTGWRRLPGSRPHVQPTQPRARRCTVYYRETVSPQIWHDTPLEDRPALWGQASRTGAAVALVESLESRRPKD